MKKFCLFAVLILCAFVGNSSAAYAREHMSIEIKSINFSNDGNKLLVFSEFINDGDVDLNVTKAVLNSLRVWEDMDGGMILQANNITADNLDIFVRADHYVEYTFTLNITNAERRYFAVAPKWEFNYNIFYRRVEEDTQDEDNDDDYEEDEEDDSF